MRILGAKRTRMRKGLRLLLARMRIVMCIKMSRSTLPLEGSDTVEISYAFGEINVKSPPKSCRNQGQKSEIKLCASLCLTNLVRLR